MITAMIPARMGSQRLKKKNLRELLGVPLITHTIRKCISSGVFDEIWVNSEHPDFGKIALQEGVNFHQRPDALGNNEATSEQYITEFLEKHSCDKVFQVHSIAPLLTAKEIRDFVIHMESSDLDCLLSVEEIQIECVFDGKPVNFNLSEKTNSQDLMPVQRLCWAITGWRRSVFLEAVSANRCATYTGRIGYYTLGPLASHVIKTERDLRVAEALLPLVE
jgi:CMP-N-acetylneuraminic acid synthetase